MSGKQFTWQLCRTFDEINDLVNLYEREAGMVEHPSKRAFLLFLAGHMASVRQRLTRLAVNENVSLPRPRRAEAGTDSCFAFLSVADMTDAVVKRFSHLRSRYRADREKETDFRTRHLSAAMVKVFSRSCLLARRGGQRLGADQSLPRTEYGNTAASRRSAATLRFRETARV